MKLHAGVRRRKSDARLVIWNDGAPMDLIVQNESNDKVTSVGTTWTAVFMPVLVAISVLLGLERVGAAARGRSVSCSFRKPFALRS